MAGRRKCPSVGTVLISLVYVGVIVALPFVVWDFYSSGAPVDQVAWFIGGVFVLLSIPISLSEVYHHLRRFEQPELQTYVVRILWMVPIYGVESWFSLRYAGVAIYMATLRELYEAWVIYCFVQLLIAYLGGEEELVRKLATKPPELGRHMMCGRCTRPWTMGRQFLVNCKFGTLQYVVLKVVVSVATFICQSLGVYEDGSFSPNHGYLYCALVNNLSQTWALYILAMFYRGLGDDLAPIKPLAKFTVIKGVVFFTWWQGFGLTILVLLGVLRDGEHFTAQELAAGLQDFLICVEMFFAAIAHKYAFPVADFSTSSGAGEQQTHLMRSFLDSTVPLDLIQDVSATARGSVRASASARSDGKQRLASVQATDEEARFARERAELHAAYEDDV